jgi:transglutaminase/protease-like cytokinesis protein 3
MTNFARVQMHSTRLSQTAILASNVAVLAAKLQQADAPTSASSSVSTSASSSANTSGTGTPKNGGDGTDGEDEVTPKEKEDSKVAQKKKEKKEEEGEDEEKEQWWEEDRAPCCGKACRCVMMRNLKR